MKHKIDFQVIGHGEKKRQHNINVIKDLILEGLEKEQIYQKLCVYITSKRFEEYYTIALLLIAGDNPPPKYDTYEKVEKKAKK